MIKVVEVKVCVSIRKVKKINKEPCPCVIGEPKVTSNVVKIHEIPGNPSWDDVRNVLTGWGVKSEDVIGQYEQGFYFDSAQFQTFSFLVKTKPSATFVRYNVFVGAIRQKDGIAQLGLAYAAAGTYVVPICNIKDTIKNDGKCIPIPLTGDQIGRIYEALEGAAFRALPNVK